MTKPFTTTIRRARHGAADEGQPRKLEISFGQNRPWIEAVRTHDGPFGLTPSAVNWSAVGDMPPTFTRQFAEALTVAADWADGNDGLTIDNDPDAEHFAANKPSPFNYLRFPGSPFGDAK